jgi:hypothetical protein
VREETRGGQFPRSFVTSRERLNAGHFENSRLANRSRRERIDLDLLTDALATNAMTGHRSTV